MRTINVLIKSYIDLEMYISMHEQFDKLCIGQQFYQLQLDMETCLKAAVTINFPKTEYNRYKTVRKQTVSYTKIKENSLLPIWN